MEILMSGWGWIALAGVLAAFEILLPGYVFLSGAAAIALTGALMLTGVWPFGFPMSLVFAAFVSGLVWVALTRLLPERRGTVRVWREDINEDINAGRHLRARGSE